MIGNWTEVVAVVTDQIECNAVTSSLSGGDFFCELLRIGSDATRKHVFDH